MTFHVPLWIALALSIFASTAFSLPPGVAQPLVLAPSKDNPRNSEGDFIVLKSGRVVFIYTHFTGGSSDEATAHLASRFSDDGGRSWSEKDEVPAVQIGKENTMSVSLLRLADGRIALFYLVKNSPGDCRPFVQFSSDETSTWTAPSECVKDAAYLVMNNNRAVQLSRGQFAGRIVLPIARHSRAGDKPGFHPGVAMCYLSDDAGATFTKSTSELQAPEQSRSGMQEPLVIERKDSSLLMLIRTDQGVLFQSESTDGGMNWTDASPTDVKSPLSPASVARIPGTGDLLMVWNDHSQIDERLKNRRTPLTVAVSKDEGRTWIKRRTLYDDPAGWYCYTAIAFAGDRVLLGHCAGIQAPKESGLATTVVTDFAVDWLYR